MIYNVNGLLWQPRYVARILLAEVLLASGILNEYEWCIEFSSFTPVIVDDASLTELSL